MNKHELLEIAAKETKAVFDNNNMACEVVDYLCEILNIVFEKSEVCTDQQPELQQDNFSTTNNGVDYVAENIASVVEAWVDGGINMGTNWRNGLANIIKFRLNRLNVDVTKPHQEQDAVVWQYRLRPDWCSNKTIWSHWKDCSKEQYDEFQRFPLVNNWVFESRQLYTTPPHYQIMSYDQKDAMRWRFLLNNSYDKEGVTQFHIWQHSWEPHSQTGEPIEWKQRLTGYTLDSFIDLAIKAKNNT